MKLRCTIQRVEHVDAGPQQSPVMSVSVRCYFLVADGFTGFDGFHMPTKLFGSKLLPLGTPLTIFTDDVPSFHCTTHGERTLPWIVCTHVADEDVTPHSCTVVTDEPVGGEVLCKACSDACEAHRPPPTLRMACSKCVIARWPEALTNPPRRKTPHEQNG